MLTRPKTLLREDIRVLQKESSSFRAESCQSPLGYLGVLQGEYALPEDFPRAALFHQVRALAEGLDLDPVGAAQYIYRELHQPELVVDLLTSLDFS